MAQAGDRTLGKRSNGRSGLLRTHALGAGIGRNTWQVAWHGVGAGDADHVARACCPAVSHDHELCRRRATVGGARDDSGRRGSPWIDGTGAAQEGGSLPAARAGIISAVVLGIARAIGETMIVWILSGGTPTLPSFGGPEDAAANLMRPFRGVPDTIAIEMGNVDFEGVPLWPPLPAGTRLVRLDPGD